MQKGEGLILVMMLLHLSLKNICLLKNDEIHENDDDDDNEGNENGCRDGDDDRSDDDNSEEYD